MTVVTDRVEPHDRIESRQVVWLTGIAQLTTNIDWEAEPRCTTPDLMETFRIVLTGMPETRTDPSPGMAREDVDALVEWLRGDSLDWEALERGDAWGD